MARATADVRLFRFMLKATRNGRAPMAVAPALGCRRGRRHPGARSGLPISFTSASNWPLLTTSRFLRSGRKRGRLIQVHGHAGFPRKAGGEIPAQGDAFFHGNAPKGNKRDHVHGADPGMRPGVAAEVDASDMAARADSSSASCSGAGSPTRLTTSLLWSGSAR